MAHIVPRSLLVVVTPMGGAVHGRRGRAPKTPTLLDVFWVRGRLKLQIKNALFRECWTRTCELQRHRRAKQERARVSAMGGAVHARRWRAPKTPTLLDVLWVDEEFCQRLRAAIETGRECCPTTVFTEPCTNRPVSNYMRPDLIRGYRAC
jgi:hypothetical protein